MTGLERVFDAGVIAVDGRPAVIAERDVLERILGRGGMAMVHAGRDLRLARQVAIKVVPAAVTPERRRGAPGQTRSRKHQPKSAAASS